MNQFLIKLSSFALLLVAVACMFEFFVFPNNRNVYSNKFTLLQKSDTEVIVSGNSHLGFAILADSLQKESINIANKARQLETDIDILLSVDFNLKKKLKHILIPISYYSLFSDFKQNDTYVVSQKRLYYQFYKIKHYSQGFLKNRLLINTPFRELINDSFLLRFMKKNKFSAKGWRANDVVFEKDEAILKKIKNLETSMHATVIINDNIKKLESLRAICEQHNIQLHLVLPPYSSYYYKLTNHQYTNRIKKELKALLELPNCNLINSNVFMTTNLNFYENSDHLNKKGAILYTQKIDSILEQYP